MITCNLYIFPKRRNSTKQPTNITPYELEGEIKHTFSPLAMSVTFNFGSITPPPYNYARIDALGRYYFIENWTYSGGLWVGSFTTDVLASFKDQIGSSYQYVTRAYSRYDASIIDTTYLSKTEDVDRQYSTLTPMDFWGADPLANNGMIVVGVIGSSSNGLGPTSYYAMSLPVFNSLMTQMLSSISWAGISSTEISTELQKALINPIQYIVSAKWYPINAASFNQGFAVTTVQLGYWSFTLSGTAHLLGTVASSWVVRQSEVSIPKSVQSLGNAGARLQYLNLAPFAEYTFKFLPFGVFPLDSTDLFGMTYLGIRVSANLISGDAVLALSAKDITGSYFFDDKPILVTQGQIGVDIPLAQITIDAQKWKNGLASAGASIVSGVANLLGGR